MTQVPDRDRAPGAPPDHAYVPVGADDLGVDEAPELDLPTVDAGPGPDLAPEYAFVPPRMVPPRMEVAPHAQEVPASEAPEVTAPEAHEAPHDFAAFGGLDASDLFPLPTSLGDVAPEIHVEGGAPSPPPEEVVDAPPSPPATASPAAAPVVPAAQGVVEGTWDAVDDADTPDTTDAPSPALVPLPYGHQIDDGRPPGEPGPTHQPPSERELVEASTTPGVEVPEVASTPPSRAAAPAASSSPAASVFSEAAAVHVGEAAPRGPVVTDVRRAPEAPAPPIGYGAFGHGAPDAQEAGVVTARGTGEVRVSPDVVTVNLGVEVQGETMERARAEAAEKTASLIAAVKAMKIPASNLRTSDVRVSPVYEHRRAFDLLGDKLPRVIGYRASGGLVMRVGRRDPDADDLAQVAARLVDAAVGAGANMVGGVHFGLEQPEVAAHAVLATAVQDARANVEAIAAASGVKVGAFHSVREAPRGIYDGDDLGAPTAAAAATSFSPAGAPTPIEAGDVVVRRSVVARWFVA